MPTIRVPTALRGLTAGASEVEVAASTVRAAFDELERLHPGIAARLFEAGALRPFIRVFVGADDLDARGGLDAALGAGDELTIVPAIAGGRDA